jgi:hypothetical protein
MRMVKKCETNRGVKGEVTEKKKGLLLQQQEKLRGRANCLEWCQVEVAAAIVSQKAERIADAFCQ